MRQIVLLAIVTALLATTAAYAHHSYGANYDVSKEIKLQGKLVQFVFRNPHAFVQMMAPDPNGTMQRWSIEWSGTTQLGAAGITHESLRVGDEIVVVVRPSRVAGEYRGLMVTLKRPVDGFAWGTREGEKVD
jgi:Family of unknown function (DUF6152)